MTQRWDRPAMEACGARGHGPPPSNRVPLPWHAILNFRGDYSILFYLYNETNLENGEGYVGSTNHEPHPNSKQANGAHYRARLATET